MPTERDPTRLSVADLCKAEGCRRRRLASSDVCPEHLNARLGREKERREREEASSPRGRGAGPGGRGTPDGAAPLRKLRDEIAARVEKDLGDLRWPPLLGFLHPKALLGAFGSSAAWLPPELEIEAWRLLHAVADAGYLEPAFLRGLAERLGGALSAGGGASAGSGFPEPGFLQASLRFLYRRWFRVKATGLEHVPASGGVLVVANRSAVLPWDAAMVATAVAEASAEDPAAPERSRSRPVRIVAGSDWLPGLPLVAGLLARAGLPVAAPADAEDLLRDGHSLLALSEGTASGLAKLLARDPYRLGPFEGRELVGAALRAEAPLVPCAVVGAAVEAAQPFPSPWLAALRLLSPIPAPSSWRIRFGRPLRPPRRRTPQDALGAEDEDAVADDAARLAGELRDAVQGLVGELLAERGPAW